MNLPSPDYLEKVIVLDREGRAIKTGFLTNRSLIEIEDTANKKVFSYHACAKKSEIQAGGAVLLVNGDRVMRMAPSHENHKPLSMWQRQQWHEALLQETFTVPKHV